MAKIAENQRVADLPQKKHMPEFSPKNVENSVESRQSTAVSKPFPYQNPKNGLEKARTLCHVANENADVRITEQATRLIRFYTPQIKRIIEAQLNLKGSVPHELTVLPPDPPALWLSQQLASLVDSGQCLVASVSAVRDKTTGQMRFIPRDVFQEMLDEVLRDPKIDPGRFTRCKVCNGFFYKPRESSRTCSRKCESVLVARDRYAKQKENRARALELRRQGKSPFQIAGQLKIKLAKVRQYLAAEQKKVTAPPSALAPHKR